MFVRKETLFCCRNMKCLAFFVTGLNLIITFAKFIPSYSIIFCFQIHVKVSVIKLLPRSSTTDIKITFLKCTNRIFHHEVHNKSFCCRLHRHEWKHVVWRWLKTTRSKQSFLKAFLLKKYVYLWCINWVSLHSIWWISHHSACGRQVIPYRNKHRSNFHLQISE